MPPHLRRRAAHTDNRRLYLLGGGFATPEMNSTKSVVEQIRAATIRYGMRLGQSVGDRLRGRSSASGGSAVFVPGLARRFGAILRNIRPMRRE